MLVVRCGSEPGDRPNSGRRPSDSDCWTVRGFRGAVQMMPLLMAVAIAMARLLADSFWMAWVT